MSFETNLNLEFEKEALQMVWYLVLYRICAVKKKRRDCCNFFLLRNTCRNIFKFIKMP